MMSASSHGASDFIQKSIDGRAAVGAPFATIEAPRRPRDRSPSAAGAQSKRRHGATPMTDICENAQYFL